ncbi:Rho GTPase-activating protein 2 [Linum perenne]
MSGRLNSINFSNDTQQREGEAHLSNFRTTPLSFSTILVFSSLSPPISKIKYITNPLQSFIIGVFIQMTGLVMVTKGGGCGGGVGDGGCKGSARASKVSCEDEQNQQLSTVAILLAAIRKSLVSSCRIEDGEDLMSSSSAAAATATAVRHMDIGWPTNVQHITHVTFDRFNGFLGLPVEFEVEIPSRVPSASASVFGVSAESMQCCYDSKGNSVPTILLLMQEKLYTQDGLKAEGIFRINPENGQEEHVRDQLNRGIVPDDIDVHCLAGLIKAWFRELPSGVLDGLSPEHVLQCNTEEESVELVKQLKPTEAALLNWAVDLMADVVHEEEHNKMNARNIAMVFAPNMTQMSDPLTALMHAVQVMNLLKTLITKNLREREETGSEGYSPMYDEEEDCDSQQDMDTNSIEQRQGSSDYDYDPDSENNDDHEVESLSQIEELFLNALDESVNTNTNGLSGESSSKRNCCALKMKHSDVSFADSQSEELASASASSDDEDAKASLIAVLDERNQSRICKCGDDVQIEEEVAHFIFPML